GNVLTPPNAHEVAVIAAQRPAAAPRRTVRTLTMLVSLLRAAARPAMWAPVRCRMVAAARTPVAGARLRRDPCRQRRLAAGREERGLRPAGRGRGRDRCRRLCPVSATASGRDSTAAAARR